MKILFFSHTASNTGAPKVLLNLIKWISRNKKNVKSSILFLQSGPMIKDFSAISARVDSIEDLHNQYVNSKLNILLGRKPLSFEQKKNKLLSSLRDEQFDLIYVNSFSSLEEAVNFKIKYAPGTKLILHLHELAVITLGAGSNIVELLGYVDSYIAASSIVKETFCDLFKINRDSVMVFYEFIDKEDVDRFQKSSAANRIMIGSCGWVHWRKGPELFIQVARVFYKKYNHYNVYFNWVGYISNEDANIINHDLLKLNLTKKISFIGERENGIDIIKNYDVLLLTSREDPFPLVCIEAGILGIPTICFEKATGITEVINDGGGVVVPYLDIEAMADAINDYIINKELYEKDSSKAKEIFSAFTTDNICPRVYQYLEDLIKNKKLT